jgi:hypothetical protein
VNIASVINLPIYMGMKTLPEITKQMLKRFSVFCIACASAPVLHIGLEMAHTTTNA